MEKARTNMAANSLFFSKPCINCKLSGNQNHHVRLCEGPTDEDGFLSLCPVCQDTSHLIDECEKLADYTTAEYGRTLFHYLVQDRAGIAPLRTSIVSWEQVATWNIDSNPSVLPVLAANRGLSNLERLGIPPPLEPAEALRYSDAGVWRYTNYSQRIAATTHDELREYYAKKRAQQATAYSKSPHERNFHRAWTYQEAWGEYDRTTDEETSRRVREQDERVDEEETCEACEWELQVQVKQRMREQDKKEQGGELHRQEEEAGVDKITGLVGKSQEGGTVSNIIADLVGKAKVKLFGDQSDGEVLHTTEVADGQLSEDTPPKPAHTCGKVMDTAQTEKAEVQQQEGESQQQESTTTSTESASPAAESTKPEATAITNPSPEVLTSDGSEPASNSDSAAESSSLSSSSVSPSASSEGKAQQEEPTAAALQSTPPLDLSPPSAKVFKPDIPRYPFPKQGVPVPASGSSEPASDSRSTAESGSLSSSSSSASPKEKAQQQQSTTAIDYVPPSVEDVEPETTPSIRPSSEIPSIGDEPTSDSNSAAESGPSSSSKGKSPQQEEPLSELEIKSQQLKAEWRLLEPQLGRWYQALDELEAVQPSANLVIQKLARYEAEKEFANKKAKERAAHKNWQEWHKIQVANQKKYTEINKRNARYSEAGNDLDKLGNKIDRLLTIGYQGPQLPSLKKILDACSALHKRQQKELNNLGSDLGIGIGIEAATAAVAQHHLPLEDYKGTDKLYIKRAIDVYRAVGLLGPDFDETLGSAVKFCNLQSRSDRAIRLLEDASKKSASDAAKQVQASLNSIQLKDWDSPLSGKYRQKVEIWEAEGRLPHGFDGSVGQVQKLAVKFRVQQ